MSTDGEKITRTCLNYLEGWYEGDVNKMEKALHPDLAKRGIQTLQKTNQVNLVHLGRTNMIEYTRAQVGKLASDETMENRIVVLDISENIASAKAVSSKYIDFVHLVRINEDWQIVNVLWEMR